MILFIYLQKHFIIVVLKHSSTTKIERNVNLEHQEYYGEVLTMIHNVVSVELIAHWQGDILCVVFSQRLDN